MSAPIIITACFDEATQARLDALRERYFPPGRTVLGAHLTMFHAIAASKRDVAMATVETLCGQRAPFAARLCELFNLGRGVAVRIDSPQLVSIRKHIAAPLRGSLTAQDAQPYRPHVTLANKMLPDDAKALLAMLQAGWTPREAQIEALTMWRYMGPHWELDRRVPIEGAR